MQPGSSLYRPAGRYLALVPMKPSGSQLPEPLRPFEGLQAALSGELRQLDELRDRYNQEKGAGRVLPNAAEALRVELTYHSNAIEGNTLSLRETQLVIEGRTPPGGKSMRELYEARNHDRALRDIENRAASGWTPILESDILRVHGMVLADIDPTWAGRFRDGRVLIAGTPFVPPGSQKFAQLIPALLAAANRTRVHPVLRATEIHYNLVAVHPFNDGNGRTSRLMMNDLLLRSGYPCAIIEVGERAEYLQALAQADSGRCEPIARFVANCLARTMQRILGD